MKKNLITVNLIAQLLMMPFAFSAESPIEKSISEGVSQPGQDLADQNALRLVGKTSALTPASLQHEWINSKCHVMAKKSVSLR